MGEDATSCLNKQRLNKVRLREVNRVQVNAMHAPGEVKGRSTEYRLTPNIRKERL